MKLIYVADPMCSWCYGFGKELTALTERVPDLNLEIIVGGLRPHATDVLDDAGKQMRLQHWRRVQSLSGLPFNREAFTALEGFVYDTEPVCRAVVTARRIAGSKGLLKVFRAFQNAFYQEGRNTTDGHVLTDIAVNALRSLGVPVSVDEFYDTFVSAETRDETLGDFKRARALGVQSFPALLLERNGKLFAVSSGYASVDELEHRLTELERNFA
jgi:putative protein-disulfide isomerase